MFIKALYPYFCSIRVVTSFIVFICALSLSVALISQYVFGLQPCLLCSYQRVPYVFAIFCGVIGLMSINHSRIAPIIMIIFCGILFFINTGIAGYHVGIEQEWWTGSSGCTIQLPENATLEELREAVINAPVTKCDDIQWSLFGVSMAGYNYLLSLVLAILSITSASLIYKEKK